MLKKMKNKNYSILRSEEYKRLSNLVLDGAILDIGGSKRSGYHELIKGNHIITTVNINPEHECDLVFDIQEKFPLEDEKYDSIISLNVFEHIYNFHNAFSESSRVLKTGGKFIISTPFMFNIHGSPDDYFRYTKSALVRILKENGFADIEIKELGFGLFSLLFQTIGGVIPGDFLKRIIKKAFISIDLFLLLVIPRYQKIIDRIPLGYFVIARKN